MDRTQGYLLPDGELGDDEIGCTVVFYPDRTEYRAALQGSLAYLATWIAWEKDADKRGKHAADNWREAYELTMECWRMGCLEQLTDDMRDILFLLQNKKDCCDDNLTYGPSTEVDTDIVPEEGDPPDYYGETAVVDWADWYEHVCFNAHAWVDELIRQADTISTALSIGGIVLGLVAASLTLLAYVATGGFIYAPDVMLIARSLITSGTDSMFVQAQTDIELARDTIICALIQGLSVSDAVEDALSIPATWTLFFQHVDYDSATAVLYEGGQGENYLPAETRDDCFCESLLVYGVGGSPPYCNTFDKEGSYRYPPSGYADSWITYQHSLVCNDLTYLGSVGRLKFYDNLDALEGRRVEVWVTDYSLAGGLATGDYQYAITFKNTVGGEIEYITHAAFEEGHHYINDNVHDIEVYCGETGSATINWKYLD